MQDGFSAKVLDVLSNPMNLPQEFLDYMVQNQAVNGLATPPKAVDVLDWETKTSNVSTSGTTFATGIDLLSSSLSFTAVGGNSYLFQVCGYGWFNNTASTSNFISINLGGSDAGIMVEQFFTTANQTTALRAAGIITPSSGSHTANVRLYVSGGTGFVQAGAGGAGVKLPLFVSISVL